MRWPPHEHVAGAPPRGSAAPSHHRHQCRARCRRGGGGGGGGVVGDSGFDDDGAAVANDDVEDPATGASDDELDPLPSSSGNDDDAVWADAGEDGSDSAIDASDDDEDPLGGAAANDDDFSFEVSDDDEEPPPDAGVDEHPLLVASDDERDASSDASDDDEESPPEASDDGADSPPEAIDDGEDSPLGSADDERDALPDTGDDDDDDSPLDATNDEQDPLPDASDDASDSLPGVPHDHEDPPPGAGGAPTDPVLPPEHKAHAIIDQLSPAIDRDDDGEEVVELTGYRSHTHAFSEDGEPGRLVATTWFNDETQEQLGTGLSVKAAFPLGSTNVRLDVVDSTGDLSSAYGLVSVTSSVLPGAFCSYYAGPLAFPLPLDVRSGPRPVSSERVTALDFGKAHGARPFLRGPHAPAGTQDAHWALRCVYLFPAPHDGYYHFAAESDGATVVTTAGKRVVWRNASSGWDTYWSGGWVHLSAGLNEMQVMYEAGGAEHLRVVATDADGGKGETVGGDWLRYDQDAVVPTVLSVEPSSSSSAGGDVVSIYGEGFFTNSTDVAFGGVPATQVTHVGPALLTAVVPAAADGDTREVALTVTTGAAAGPAAGGTSNAVPFHYVPNAAAVAFRHDTVKTADGAAPFALPSGISIVIGPDGRYYIGTYTQGVMALTIDVHHRVQSQCLTGSLGDRSAIVGLAFNPADGPDVRLYAAASTLYYERNLGVPKSAWNNGKVLLLEPNDECLGVTREVITGLPVSNHDHGTSALSFDQDGNLRFITGGMSNMGTATNAERLGGVTETPLSAAMLVAYINRPNFDGAITYSQTEDQDTADQTGGWDVEIFATGIRSAFGGVLHTNGEQYVTDNGPNAEFGDASASCTSVVPGGTHGDELLHVTRGGYYGHANRNRGRSHPRECAYRWPNAPARNGYTPPLLSFDSGSYTGIVEVLSNVFPDLKHDLLITRFTGGVGGQEGVTKRIRLSGGGTRAAFAGDLVHASGVDLTETPHGSYLMPRVQKGELLYVAPVHPPSRHDDGGGQRPFFIAVKPHRGRPAGGNVVTVGGLALGTAPTATFGGKPCTAVHAVAADGTSFRCTVPPADTPGALVRVVVTTAEGVETRGQGRGDFWYMN